MLSVGNDFITLGANLLLLNALLANQWVKFRLRVILQIILTIFALLPIYHNLNALEIMRGVIGDISITSFLVFGFVLFNGFYPRLGVKVFMVRIPITMRVIVNYSTIVIMIVLGVVLYLSTFGVIGYDLYALGYYPNFIMLGLVAILTITFWASCRILAWIWVIALFAYYLHIQHSNNLWDYLFDPVLWCYYLFQGIYLLVFLIKKYLFKK